MSKKTKTVPEHFINRELSWLEFNDRVLGEGVATDVALLERMKFLAIVGSNLDETFMIRVAGLMQQRASDVRRRDPSGMTPDEQLQAFSRRAHRMVEEQSTAIRELLRQLREHGLIVLEANEWTAEQSQFLAGHFTSEIAPVLTPLAIEDLEPKPLLPGLQLHVAAVLGPREGNDGETIVVVPVPGAFSRFVRLHAGEDVALVRLEDVIASNVGLLFPSREVLATAVFRITRDADVAIADEDADDLLDVVAEAVRDRRRRAPVRLEISARPDERLRKWLVDWLRLAPEDVYEIDGMLDATALWHLANWPGFDILKEPDWPAQPPRDLMDQDDLFEAIRERDVLLVHPYESFDPVIRLLEQAAADPHVLSIKQTLYRTSGESPIIRALEHAGGSGKEVTVLVELKARFDEARNVQWAKRLEDAGCHVIYGIAGLKTHAKALLIVRRETYGFRRYVHLATGNYNDRTARLYSDIGLMTCDRELATDVANFFNVLTGHSDVVGWSKLAVAPTGLRRRFIDLIRREAKSSTPDDPGLIMAKMNSIEDREVCEALYEASQAGVKVLLNVRGICCLRPGVKGVSENIEVTSIVDRFLEHSRIFYFHNAGHDEVYLSSADWMRRNLSKRLELLFPVSSPKPRRRLIDMLKLYFADNVKARRLLPDGTYQRVTRRGRAVRAQEWLHEEAVDAAKASQQTHLQFRPLSRPSD
ncbi:MAG TPA: polyphosphate kinase 1 [Thermoguttaceae bacterium]|nr:polyphosphate kinase 1 [Thermoguttaceae bacterium]